MRTSRPGNLAVPASEAAEEIAPLRGCRILVIEDEYFLADDIAQGLRCFGAAVAGPVGTVGEALDLLDAVDPIDGAVLDINLRGETILPVARALRATSLPFIVTTGYARASLDPELQDVPIWEKPVDVPGIARALARLIGRR